MTVPGLGGQQPPPQNSAPAGQLTPGVTPGVSGQIIAQRVIVTGSNGSVLVYASAPPKLGNLVASISSFETTDPFGNQVLPGIASYVPGPPFWFGCTSDGGGIVFFSATAAAGPYTLNAQIFVGTNGVLNINLENNTVAGAWPQSGGSGITTVAQVVTVLENLGLLTP